MNPFHRRKVAVVTLGLSLAAGGGLAAPARAQQPAAAAAAPAVAPLPIAAYVDETALAVLEVDLSRVDVDAGLRWTTALLKQGGLPKEHLDAFAAQAAGSAGPLKKVLAAFAEAGGRRLYVVGMMNQQAPVAVIVQPAAGGDPAKLVRLFTDGSTLPKDVMAGATAAAVGGAAVWGSPAAVAAVRDAHANPDRQPRPDLAAALAAAGDAAVKVAFSPPAHVRGLLTISQPTLPPDLGGGPTGPVVEAFKYATVAVDPPTADAATGALRLTVQARDAAGAQRLKGVVDAAFAGIRNDPPFRRDVPDGDKLLDALTPKVDGDKLTLPLDPPAFDAVAKVAAPAVVTARENARRAQSMSNLRQLCVCVIFYTNENKGRLPEKFPADLAPYAGGPDDLARVLRNPSQPERSPGYTYVVPEGAAKIADVREPARTVILYETHDAWPAGGVAVGYLDGHVEWVADEAVFKQQVGKK